MNIKQVSCIVHCSLSKIFFLLIFSTQLVFTQTHISPSNRHKEDRYPSSKNNSTIECQSYSQPIQKNDGSQGLIKTNNIISSANSLPLPPKVYPSNGATNIPLIPEFVVLTVNGADTYGLQISTDSNFYQIIAESYQRFGYKTTANDTVYLAAAILSPNSYKGNTTYYWRTRAYLFDGSDTSPWSSPFSYRTKPDGPAISSPNLLLPSYASTLSWINVPFVWDNVSNATHYQVQYSTDANFNGFTYWWPPGTQTSLYFGLKPKQAYYWRVVAYTDFSISQFSATYMFYTGNLAVLSEPTQSFDDGSGLDNYDNNLDLSWLISPTDAQKIVLSFSSFRTEKNYDFVTIYDGSTTASPVLGKFSGSAIPNSIISSGGTMLVRFTSDGFVADSGWGASYYSLSGDKLFPSLTLSTGSLFTGNSLTLYVKHMTNGGVVKLTLSSPDTTISSTVLANTQGSASTTFYIPIDAAEGTYVASALDISSDRSAPNKYLNVQRSQAVPAILWASSIADTIFSNQKFYLQWTDLMTIGAPYTTDGATRKYAYRIQLSSNDGLSWSQIKTINGGGRVNDRIMMSTDVSIQNPGRYQFRIVDSLMASRSLISNKINIVTPPSNAIDLALAWDYSYTSPIINAPLGVAADGVSRLYMIASLSKSASKVQITLSDEFGDTDVRKIGKVMDATTTDQFSDEANNAISTSASQSRPINGNQYWFWYVAPDDFVGNNTSNQNASEKTVWLTVNALLTDGTNISKKMPIKVVRPPLLFIHGLGGSSSTWSNFGYDYQGAKQLFINDNRFLVKSAPSIINNAGFNVGSIWIKNRCVQLIRSMRELGYSSNQVMYVSHSMGGNYLRAFVENPSYSTPTNYSKGYVNRAILLDCPNDGSPLANLLSAEIIPFINQNIYARDLIKTWYLFDPSIAVNRMSAAFLQFNGDWPNLNYISPTDAILDLRTILQGGHVFAKTNVPAHLVAGDFFAGIQGWPDVPPELWSAITNGQDFLELMDKLSDILVVIYPPAGAAAKETTDLALRTMLILDYALKAYSTTSFLLDSDIMVSIQSQLAGLETNAANVSVFDNVIHWGDWSNSVTSRLDVGDLVSNLLNINSNSNTFGSIPTNSTFAKILASQGSGTSASVRFGVKTTGLRIVSLSDTTNLLVDSTLNIHFSLQDTAGLQYVKLFFQGKSYISYDRAFDQGFTIQVSGTYLNDQPLEILSVYRSGDSTYWSYDKRLMKVNTLSQVSNFYARPKVVEIPVGQRFSPEYLAVYSTFLSKVSSNSSDLHISIQNPSVLSLNSGTNMFTGKSKGETSVIIAYKGLTDTMFFAVDDSAVITGVPHIGDVQLPTHFSLNQNYPNPFNPSTSISYDLPVSGRVALEIYDLLGRKVKIIVDEWQQAGAYTAHINMNGFSSGVYFFRIKFQEYIAVRKMLLLK
ncbi:MAG: T9SS type A sorting domain-containing protein [Ignavibacteriales bacterium]|nr:T9SS type A sorting domain-containing protein [Ignavibacteriales bacterium]